MAEGRKYLRNANNLHSDHSINIQIALYGIDIMRSMYFKPPFKNSNIPDFLSTTMYFYFLVLTRKSSTVVITIKSFGLDYPKTALTHLPQLKPNLSKTQKYDGTASILRFHR